MGWSFYDLVFDKFCADKGIVRQKIVRLTPQYNGLIERMNRTLMDKVRCMMIQVKLPMSLWAEALNIACYLVNLSHSSVIGFKTSYEIWTKKNSKLYKPKDVWLSGICSYKPREVSFKNFERCFHW